MVSDLSDWKGNSTVFDHYVHWIPKEENAKKGNNIKDSSFDAALSIPVKKLVNESGD